MNEDDSLDPRRDFLARMLKKAADKATDGLADRLSVFGLPQDAPAHPQSARAVKPPPTQSALSGFTYDRPWFRPPGAVPEAEFLDTCSRCAKCVEVCPEYCIVPAQAHTGAPRGSPIMYPNEEACTLCGKCMDACPSGALLPVPRELIRIGIARINEQTCIGWGEHHCTACHDACPVEPNAISFPEGFEGTSPRVDIDACTGCGLCVRPCPTGPKSILVHLRPIQLDLEEDEQEQ